MLYSDIPYTYYGICTYVGFATYCRATVKIRLYLKGLMIMKCLYKKKKKKKWSSQIVWNLHLKLLYFHLSSLACSLILLNLENILYPVQFVALIYY